MTFEDKTSHLVSSLLCPTSVVIPGCLDVFFCPRRWCLNWFLGWELFRCMSLGDSVPEGPLACRWDPFPKDGASAFHAMKEKNTWSKMHGILRRLQLFNENWNEIFWFDVGFFPARSEQFSRKKTLHTGIENPNCGPKFGTKNFRWDISKNISIV